MPLLSIAAMLHRLALPSVRALWRAAVLLVVTVWSLCLLAWLILHWGILPRLDEWRPSIERLASRALGQTLTIASGTVEI